MDKKKLYIKLPQIKNDIKKYLRQFPRINRKKTAKKDASSPIIKHTIVKILYDVTP